MKAGGEKMYKVDGRNAQILLGYEDVFHEKAPDLITEIKKLNMHKAISVICELIALRNKKMKPVDTQYLTGVIFPLESYLKKQFSDLEKHQTVT